MKKFQPFYNNTLIQFISNGGGCIASDKITVDGMLVGYMCREEPANDCDSGWCFFSNTEDQEYLDNLENSCVFDLNTIVNYDPAILPYLEVPVGTKLERIEGKNMFRFVEE